MKINLNKRINCYFIDLVIIAGISFLVSILIPKSNTYIGIQNEISSLSSNYLNNEIVFSEYFSSFSELSKDLDKANIVYLSINFIMMLLYFVVIPLLLEGRTLGMIIFKFKVKVKNYKNIVYCILARSIVAYGLLYYLFQLCLLYLVPSNIYLIMLTILSIIQILVVICSAFMIKYRDDKRSLADILSCSNIIES